MATGWPRKPWTEDEDRILRVLFPYLTTVDVSAILKKPYGVVHNRAGVLEVKKDQDWVRIHARANALKAGESSRFQKGIRPWNSGTKGKGVMKANSGTFRKGNLPHNTRKDGDTSIRKDKAGRYYLHRRTALGVWSMEHVLLWEDAHGPAPDGMVIAFKDGNTAHLRLENLECISRAALMQRNTIHRLPEDLKDFIRQLMSFNIQLQKIKKRHGKEQDRRPPQPAV